MFFGEILKNHLLQEIFLRNEVLKIFCERDILRKLLCSKGLVTRDANSWSNFYSTQDSVTFRVLTKGSNVANISVGRVLDTSLFASCQPVGSVLRY